MLRRAVCRCHLECAESKSLGIQGASAVDAAQLLGCLALRQPHSLILVPQLLLMLVIAAEQKAFSPHGLRFAAVGGARVSRRCCTAPDNSACRSTKATGCRNALRW